MWQGDYYRTALLNNKYKFVELAIELGRLMDVGESAQKKQFETLMALQQALAKLDIKPPQL